MVKSQNVGTLAAALAKAQGAMQPAEKDRTNPFYKSRYATLDSVWEAARKPLAGNGLAVTQTCETQEDGTLVLVTTLMHESGEWISSALPVIVKEQTAQALGGGLTYARRYGFAAIVGAVTDEDDDGNASQQAQPAKPKPAQQTPQAAPDHGRPMQPDALRAALRARAEKAPAELDTDKANKMGFMALKEMFGSEDNQRAAIRYLFDREHRNAVTPQQYFALNAWRDAKKNDAGEWVPSGYAIQEAALVLAEAALLSTELFPAVAETA
jgi:hypothetical protein